MNILDMILELQENAKRQGGALKDIALPEQLFEELKHEVIRRNFTGVRVHALTGKYYIHDTLVHTGEED